MNTGVFLEFFEPRGHIHEFKIIGKTFLCDYFIILMSFNAGAQISDTSFKSFVGILPKIPLFLLFKALISLSISLTSVFKK